jgi:hypothetical protein
MKKILILIIIGFTFSIFSCKDKEEIIRIVDPELKEWGLYQKGTWWVYEEENTKAIDSFWVDSISKSFYTDEAWKNKKWEEMKTFIISNEGLDKNYFIPISSLSSIVQIFTYLGIEPENANASVLLSTKLKKKERFASCNAFKWAEMDTIYDSLIILGNNFKNVVRVFDMCNSAFMGQKTYFYSVKNIGIVRKEFPEINQIWNLVKYHIVQ